MSNIDKQIAELQRKKKKIEFLKHILNSVIDYTAKDFEEVQPEVQDIMSEFINSKIEEIENGPKPQKKATPVQPTQNDPMAGPGQKPAQPQAQPIPGNEKPSVQQMASFALENRHLSGKTVTAVNAEGGEVKGEVVGLDYPHVLIRTDEGPVIKAPRERLKI